MDLYYIEETALRKESPNRFVSESRGRYHWASKDKADKYTPRELMAALKELSGFRWVFQPTPVEADEHEPT